MSMNVLEAAQRHRHPAFDVAILEDQLMVADHSFEVGIEELEHQIDVLLDREHVQ